MRRQGLTIPLPDLLIAQAAMEGNFVLWHIDEHFERMSRYSPPDEGFLAVNRKMTVKLVFDVVVGCGETT